LGNDFKAALSDAVKTALASYGIGLYLYEKEAVASTNGAVPQRVETVASTDQLVCEQCEAPITDTKFKNGETWSAENLAKAGRSKYGKTLCMNHYRQAKNEERPF
jgi:hypothetical protein